MLKKLLLIPLAIIGILLLGLNLWGALTLGSHRPDPAAARDPGANRVVMVFGATGSVGDGLLKAAMADPDVETIYAVTRRMSSRLEAGQREGRVNLILQQDFTDYSAIADQLATVNTVLWGLGTTSIGMDPELYRHIHVDFPLAFVTEWLSARQQGPMAFHYVTGMGTGEAESAQWAQDKGEAERRIAELSAGTGMRSFGHRSAWIMPTAENATAAIYLGEFLLKPGHLVIRGIDLGRAMLEISARTSELPTGTLIDNKDAIDIEPVAVVVTVLFIERLFLPVFGHQVAGGGTVTVARREALEVQSSVVPVSSRGPNQLSSRAAVLARTSSLI